MAKILRTDGRVYVDIADLSQELHENADELEERGETHDKHIAVTLRFVADYYGKRAQEAFTDKEIEAQLPAIIKDLKRWTSG